MRAGWWLPFFFAFGCSGALDLPDVVPHTGGPECAGASCEACSDLTTAASCEQRSDCYVDYSLDRMCDSSGCASHFTSCETRPVDCHVEITCTIQPPPGECDPGFVEVIGANGCSWFCVRTALCDCAALTNETSCENESACHARFDDVDDCLEPPCPPSFTECEDGPAQCTPGDPAPVDCTESLETCDSEDDFVPSYLPNGCPDGCVRSQDCPLSNGE